MGKITPVADSRTSAPKRTLANRPGAIFLLAALLMVAAQSPRGGSISGVVTDPDGASLPGVEVTATGGEVQRAVFTGVDGTYEIADVPAGTYDLRARLPGFCPEERSGVRVLDRRRVTVNFPLVLAPVEEHPPIYFRLPDALRLADAVLYVQITESYEPQIWGHSSICGIVGIEHEGLLLAEVKINPVYRRDASTVRFVQYRAGIWVDDTQTIRGSQRPYSVGSEYVAFLDWVPSVDRFRQFSGHLMIPVHDGRISWRGADEPGVRDGMPVEAFLDLLRELSR